MILNLLYKMKQSKNSVESNTPWLIDTVGNLSTTFDFSGQELSQSCGVTFRNKHLIFGGDKAPRQVVQVEDCGLVSIGTIPFNLIYGACGATEDAIVLCFNLDKNDYKRCRQASSSSGPWTQIALSTYDHRAISIATSTG